MTMKLGTEKIKEKNFMFYCAESTMYYTIIPDKRVL
jgi:hypothetical protein